MHKTTEKLLRNHLETLKGQLTPKQLNFLTNQVYPRGIIADNLENAIDLCERTIRKNEKGVDGVPKHLATDRVFWKAVELTGDLYRKWTSSFHVLENEMRLRYGIPSDWDENDSRAAETAQKVDDLIDQICRGKLASVAEIDSLMAAIGYPSLQYIAEENNA